MVKYYKHENITKQRIKQALTELSTQKRLENITMYDIARQAKLSKPTVYKYYISVEEIFDEILKDIQNDFYNNYTNLPKGTFKNITRTIEYLRKLKNTLNCPHSDLAYSRLASLLTDSILVNFETYFFPAYTSKVNEFMVSSVSVLITNTIIYYVEHENEDISEIDSYIEKIVKSIISE